MKHDQLIETRPRSGTFVATPGTNEAHEACQVRKGLEWAATGLPARVMPDSQIADLRVEPVEALPEADRGNYQPFFHSDSPIHRQIVEATGNSRLIANRAFVEPFAIWLRVVDATETHRLAGSRKRHLDTLDAMAERDVDAAQSPR